MQRLREGRVEFRVLGPLQALQDGRLIPLGGAQQRAVLAILLLQAGRVVSVDDLVDGLWGERPPETAANTLQGYVSRLRKLLTSGEDELIVHSPPGYVLRIEPERVDALRFERLLRQATEARVNDGERAAELLREALALWRGGALADLELNSFVRLEVRRLEELRMGALEERIELDLALGRHGQVVPELEALVAEHPLRERLREELMLALYRSGRQSEALATYRAARRRLVRELGIEPGRRLRELEQAILRQDESLEPPREATSPQLSDGREHGASPTGAADLLGLRDRSRDRPRRRLTSRPRSGHRGCGIPSRHCSARPEDGEADSLPAALAAWLGRVPSLLRRPLLVAQPHAQILCRARSPNRQGVDPIRAAERHEGHPHEHTLRGRRSRTLGRRRR
jgi:DNA-binding SARP family transcriptional activator